MSLNADFEYFVGYLISPFSNFLANILTLFHLSNSWAKHRSPDTGKVFNLPLKLPGVLFEKDTAFYLQFFNSSIFRLHLDFLHLISALPRGAIPFLQTEKGGRRNIEMWP